ncbi:MAG: molybdate ABC transporter permease subunit [Prolixibacteraceae bacterium]|jgi:molybdate transport system permease protein|nr:molybdate ABC transporter permease subunit [Prolixibacteraceae bacterium]
MNSEFITTLLITFKLAVITTAVLFVVGIPIAAYLAFSKNKFKVVAEALITMPMVLPPSVLGYYLLVAYSPDFFIGSFLESAFNIRLAFSFSGLVVGSVLFSLPFMISPIQSGLQNLPSSLSEASSTLGKTKLQTLHRVLLPNIKPSIITAIVLTFAHTIGEFGVVLMIGGNIPGETRVASIAIYDEVQALNFDTANKYAFILFAITFILLLLIYTFNRKNSSSWKPF